MTDDSEKKNYTLPDPSPVEHGGRVELRLVNAPSEGSPNARYEARWFTPESQLVGQVDVDLYEKPAIHVNAPKELPDWLGTFTSTLVRTTARRAKKDNNWPRRLTRWRAEPEKK